MNEWRCGTVNIWNGMQLSKCGSLGPNCLKVEKPQAFLLLEACSLLSRVGTETL